MGGTWRVPTVLYSEQNHRGAWEPLGELGIAPHVFTGALPWARPRARPWGHSDK